MRRGGVHPNQRWLKCPHCNRGISACVTDPCEVTAERMVDAQHDCRADGTLVLIDAFHRKINTYRCSVCSDEWTCEPLKTVPPTGVWTRNAK